jgi:hypothetical protein
MIYSIELDVAVNWDDPDERDDFISQLADFGLEHELVSESGPGGGWPCVDIIGPKKALRSWLSDNYCDDDEEDVDFHMERAEKHEGIV